jgi:hypothetical protein
MFGGGGGILASSVPFLRLFLPSTFSHLTPLSVPFYYIHLHISPSRVLFFYISVSFK